METYDKEPPQQEASKYNEAIASLMRLNDIFKSAYSNMKRGNYMGWNNDLDAAYRELELTEKLESKYEPLVIAIDKELVTEGLFDINNFKVTGFKKPNPCHQVRLGKIYQLLHKKEILIRKAKFEYKKGAVHQDDDDDYMD